MMPLSKGNILTEDARNVDFNLSISMHSAKIHKFVNQNESGMFISNLVVHLAIIGVLTIIVFGFFSKKASRNDDNKVSDYLTFLFLSAFGSAIVGRLLILLLWQFIPSATAIYPNEKIVKGRIFGEVNGEMISKKSNILLNKSEEDLYVLDIYYQDAHNKSFNNNNYNNLTVLSNGEYCDIPENSDAVHYFKLPYKETFKKIRIPKGGGTYLTFILHEKQYEEYLDKY